MTSALALLPQPGQLVRVRFRQWVVDEVSKSSHPPAPLDPLSETHQQLVSLLSIEDDSLGEELQVVWEIEPGAEVIEKVGFPEATGSMHSSMPAAGERCLLPTFGTSNPASARASTSRTKQLDPVVRTIQLPRVNVLVTDD
jgi:hypothetical protein